MSQLVAVKEKKTQLISKFGHGGAKDTGCPEVQVALLTDHIRSLTEHLKSHKKDYLSQLGLLKMVGQRRRILDYMKKNVPSRYVKLISDLELRK